MQPFFDAASLVQFLVFRCLMLGHNPFVAASLMSSLSSLGVQFLGIGLGLSFLYVHLLVARVVFAHLKKSYCTCICFVVHLCPCIK